MTVSTITLQPATQQDHITTRVQALYAQWRDQLLDLDRLRGYRRGELGKPALAEETRKDIKALRDVCVLNMCGLIVDTYTENLRVVGYRRSDDLTNGAGWAWFRKMGLDARQEVIHRAAATYGVAYGIALPGGDLRLRSPRRAVAVYRDAEQDRWPMDALEVWEEGGRVKGLYLDQESMWAVEFGESYSLKRSAFGRSVVGTTLPPSGRVVQVEHVGEHGATWGGEPVTPVVSFLWRHEDDEAAEGVVAPLIDEQRALNSANLDRMIVARYGAHPQWVISGWTPASPSEKLKMSASTTWTFEDEAVKATSLSPAQIAQYTELVESMQIAMALQARTNPLTVRTQLVNVGADTLASASRQEDSRLKALRTSLGESWQQLIRLGLSLDGEQHEDDTAETVWEDTRTQSFAGIVDGVVKLSDKGVPIDELLEMIPGITPAMAARIRKRMEGNQQLGYEAQLARALDTAAPRSRDAEREIASEVDFGG